MKISRDVFAGIARKGSKALGFSMNAILVVAGVAAIGYGTAMIYEPAAFIVVGGITAWFGLPDK